MKERPEGVEPQGRRGKGRVALVVVCTLLGVVILLPFLVWTGNAVKCGGRPIETSDFAAANSYTLPGESTYTYYPIFTGSVCDLSEVEGRTHRGLAHAFSD